MPADVKAVLFDVFGTVVDWRTSLIDNFTQWGNAKGIKGDWTALVDSWRGAYMPSMDDVRKHPERGFVILDDLQRQSIEPLAAKLGITGLTSADFDYLTRGWHSLHPWPDSVGGLTRLKTKFIIGPLSNGNVALLTNMAKHAGLPWDLVLSAEVFGLEHLANFDLGPTIKRRAFEPFNRLFLRLHLPQPIAGNQLLRFGEGTVDHRPLLS